jgi:hypothetical protein
MELSRDGREEALQVDLLHDRLDVEVLVLPTAYRRIEVMGPADPVDDSVRLLVDVGVVDGLKVIS